MEYIFKFRTEMERDNAYDVAELQRQNKEPFKASNFISSAVDGFYNNDGEYILKIYTLKFDVDRHNEYINSIILEDPETKEETDDYATLKKVLKYTAICLVGIIIGRKTSRYKKWKGHYPIYAEPGIYSEDWFRGADYAFDNVNKMMRDNNLVFAIDKKKKRRKK